MKYTAILLYVLLTIPNMIPAQQMEVLVDSKIKFDGKIKLNGNIYDFDESEELFKVVPIAHKRFLWSKKAKKANKVWGYTSLGTLGVGLILMATPSQDNCHGILCLSQFQVFGVLSVFLAFPITGTIGILNRANSRARFRQATELYNSNRDIGYTQKEDIKISFGLSQNGIGLVLKF